MGNSKQEMSSKLFHRIIYEWNQTDCNYLKEKAVHHLFEEQVKKTPNDIALVFEDQNITYSELNNRSNQLARNIRSTYKKLNKSELKSDSLVALMLDRSIEMVVSILAVLKAGAAYVPISPDFPNQRINYILEDIGAQILVSQSHLEDKVNLLDFNLNVIYADKDFDYPTDNLDIHISSKNLAYVIYTSGTTGKPKGVMIEHCSVVNTVTGLFNVYQLDTTDSVSFYTNYTFDVSVSEIFITIFQGASLHILNDFTRLDTSCLSSYLMNNRITYAFLPPVVLSNLPKKKYSNLKSIVIAGEKCDIKTAQYWKDQLKLFNYYGPTEATIYASGKQINDNVINSIGRPVQNTKLYILDKDLKPVPKGVEGELYIGGIGLARGYLNLPDLTQEKFISNPFATDNDKKLGYTKLYKTGDLCKWLDDGEVEYIDRNDFQVKVRGFRIELGEIESVISEIEDIQQVYVIVKHRTINNQEQNILVAYYTSNDNSKVSNELIKNYIKSKLPAYMLPNAFVKLDKVPLTLNGKLDRKALPDPNFSLNKNVATNDLEKKLCKVWSQILDIPENQINTKLSFFDLGGDSLLITRLKNELMALPECQDLSVTDLFTYNTIDKLSSFLEQESDDYITSDLQNNNVTIDKDIAVIGISGAFSGCSNLDEFWQMLISGERGLTSFDLETCRERGVLEEKLQHSDYISTSGHIGNEDLFDSKFWKISAHEAKLMDPQIRKFLEHCWLVLEKTGYAPTRSKHNIAVIAGNTTSQYFQNNILNCNERDTLDLWEASVLNTKDALATKASHLLGLTGISESINTSCSTGLVTIIEACNKLSNGLCDMAIAGSASLQLPEQTGYIYKEGMILSKDGHCRVFDEKASGTIFGSGVGTVLLKRLSDAQRDKDNIIAVVKGYALNNDGNRKISYTAPSVEGQAECIKQAFNQANISSDEIDYIECHGTGTKLGDPIEVKALSEVFKATSKNQRKQKCILGSAKANIGHIDAAAGLAGFIKLCLMFQHKQIPAQIDYDKPNPGLDLESSPFTIQTQSTDWLSDKPRIVAVSSFGFGGTNSHMIISENINSQRKEKEVKISEPYILNLSAKSPESLLAYKESFISYLSKTNDSLDSIVYTLQQRRENFDYRLAISCDDKKQAIKKLQSDIKATKCDDLSKRKVIWMFPGQGMQYPKMTYDLYQNDSLYRKTVDQCITIIDKYAKTNFKEILFTENELINQTQWTQPALFVVEYSLAKLLEHLRFEADGYIGHSIGEYVAATLSGVFNLEDALKIVLKRGELMQQMQPGSMLSISASVDTVRHLIQANSCEISVINSPVQCVASGSYDKILKLSQALDKQDIKSTILNTSHAYHSSMMIEAAQRFKKCFNKIILHRPTKPFISNISGDWIDKDFAIDPEYWATQITATVEFAKGIENSIQADNSIMLEVGPGHALSTFVQQTKTDNKVTSINLIPSAKNLNLSQVIDSYQDLKAKLWCYGYPVKLQQVKQARIALLPDYCFNFDSYWLRYDKKNNSSLQLLDKQDWLHTCIWQQAGKLTNSSHLDTNIILITNDKYLPDWITDKSIKNLILVELSNTVENLQILDSDHIKINPTLETDYMDLFNYLQSKKFECIIDCSTLSNHYQFNLTKVNRSIEYGLYHIYLLQEYILKKISSPLHYISLTQGIAKLQETDNIHPVNCSLVSAIRTLSHELKNINFAMLDIGYNQKIDIHSIMNAVVNNSISFKEHPYAIRDNYLWKETINTSGAKDISKNSSVIKDDDVILLTGGLGGIGLALLEEISKKNSLTFILTSRTEKATSVTERLFKLLNSRNCNLDIKYGDITNPNFIDKLIKYIKKNYNCLSGIIHLAGNKPLGQEKSFEDIKDAIKPKISGINNILKYPQICKKLRYCIFTSSLASIMGDVNRIEYCVANGYLDNLSSWMNYHYPSCQTLSINWPNWENTGMAKDYKKVNNIIGLNHVNKLEGAQLFYDLTQLSSYNQIIVSKLNIHKLKEKLFHSSIKSVSSNEITNKIVEKDLNENYYKIANAVLSILNIKQLSINDNLFNLGLNSLDSIQLVTLLNQQGISISNYKLVSLNSINAIYKHCFVSKQEESKDDSSDHSTVIKLKSTTASKRNIFVIHPVGGILTLYQKLVSRLPSQYNYYGIQNINVYGEKKLIFDSIESLARYYVIEILRIQSSGQFILLGASLGGTIAHEIASQLVKRGKKIQCVIMLDTWANFAPIFNDKRKCEDVMREQLKNDETLKGMDIAYPVFIDQAWEMMKLNFKYTPKKSSVRTILFKAKEVEGYYKYNKNSQDNGWKQYLSDLNAYSIDGNHLTLYQNKGLSKVLEILWKELNYNKYFYLNVSKALFFLRRKIGSPIANFITKNSRKVKYALLFGVGFIINELIDLAGFIEYIWWEYQWIML